MPAGGSPKAQPSRRGRGKAKPHRDPKTRSAVQQARDTKMTIWIRLLQRPNNNNNNLYEEISTGRAPPGQFDRVADLCNELVKEQSPFPRLRGQESTELMVYERFENGMPEDRVNLMRRIESFNSVDEDVSIFITIPVPAPPLGDRFYSDSDILGLIPIGFKPSPKETSTKGTHMSRWAVTPTGNLRLWNDFLDGVAAHEVSNTPRHTETTFTHLKALLSDKPDVSDEKTLEGALGDHVYKVLKRIAEPREKFGSHSAVGGVLGEPDCVMYVEPGDPHVQANADSLHLVIEVKLPSVLPVDDLVNKYNQDTLEFSQDHVVHDSVIHQVEQVFGYLSHNRLQYGVLTTYTNTWFLRREGGTLYVSPVVHYNDNNPTLLQCYAYTISLARQADPMEPAPATPDNLDDDNDTHNGNGGVVGGSSVDNGDSSSSSSSSEFEPSSSPPGDW